MSRILVLLTLTAVLSFPTGGFAGSETMLKLLEVLYHNGTIDEQTFKMLVAAALEEEAGRPPDPDPSQPGIAAAPDKEKKADAPPPTEPGTTVEYDGGSLRVTSADGQYQSIFNGYVQVDAARYDETNIPMGDGGEVRRARFSWRWLIRDSWLLRTSVDFADGADIKSTYIDYLPNETSSIRFGSFKEPFNMDELTSGRYTTFMERALVNALAPGRNFGLGYNTEGDQHSFKVGAYTENTNDETDPALGATGRITYAPWTERTRVLHLGLAASYRNLGEGNTVRFSARPESHVTDVRLIDTQDIADGETLSRMGLEAASVMGPLSVQGEYIRVELDRGGAPDLTFDGWYAYGSWIVTGESREYDVGNGRFRRIRPARPLGNGGSGAWELAVRYSNLDLNDDDISGGEEDNITVALNWYPHKDVRFSLNYVNVLDVDRPGSEFDGESPDIFQVRGQVQF